MRRSFISGLLVAAVACLVITIPGFAQTPPTLPCTPGESSLPSNDPEYPASQLTLVCLPLKWNGDLVVYARGFVPPQVAPILPTVPVALPDGTVLRPELTLPDGTFVPAAFLAQGFAFATSSYHKNGAFIEQGSRDLLTLVKYFETIVPPGALKRVFIVGGSEGGLITMQLLEQHPDEFSGGLALCAPAG